MHIAWLISPRMYILSFFEFFDKLSKRRVSIADASPIAKHGVKSCGLAVVIHPDFFVTLNGVYACGEAKDSDSSHHRPNQSSEIHLPRHAMKNLLFRSHECFVIRGLLSSGITYQFLS
jgi:hypothetical protein